MPLRTFRTLSLAALLLAVAAGARADTLFVAETGANDIKVYSGSGTTWSLSQTLSSPLLSAPRSIAIVGSTMYVTSEGTGQILSFNGTTWSTFATPPDHGYVNGIVSDGTHLFVAEYGSTAFSNGSILEYNLDGTLAHQFAVNGALVHPTGLAFNGGTLYVANSNGSNVVSLNMTNGNFTSYTAENSVGAPAGLAFLSGGRLYASDFFSPFPAQGGGYTGGTGITAYGSGGGNPTDFAALGGNPSGIVASGASSLLVSNYAGNASGAGTIVSFSPTGGTIGPVTATNITGLTGPTDMFYVVGTSPLAAAVPEPSSLALAGVGLSALALASARRRAARTAPPAEG
jgi:hypothetical protein